jgi:hypothetical protein
MANAVGIIRTFTADDDAALSAAAIRFAQRHFFNGVDGLSLDIINRPWQALECELGSWSDSWNTKRLQRLWQGCKCRALGEHVRASVTVAYGYVGHRVD